MFLTIIQLVLPIAIKLWAFYLEKTQASDERKKEFIAFVEKMENTYLNSVNIHKSVQAQKERLRASIGVQKY